MARRAPALSDRKMFKAAVSAPVDDNQLIISCSSSSEDDDVKNGLRIKTEENKMVEVQAKV